ncbi:MAG: hypothetical protein ACRDTK_07575 [Mycobacterium sp.]
MVAPQSGNDGQSSSTGAREQQLEQRVNQLEQELQQLKSQIQTQQGEIEAQRAAPPPPEAVAKQPAAPVTNFGSQPSGPTISLHGFVGATGFWQSQNFSYSNGTQAEFPVPGSRNDQSFTGGDLRNTRLWVEVSNYKLGGGWEAGLHLSFDFQGGFNGTGPFASEQETPRARQLFVSLEHPDTGTKVTIGKQLDLLFPTESVPLSYAHIAFPIGFGVGEVGWRFPGVVLWQDLGHPAADSIHWRLDAGIFEGQYNGPGSNTNFNTAGNVGFRPQLEVRLHAQKGDWLAYVTGHYESFDLGGITPASVVTPIKRRFSSEAVVVGGAWTPGPWVFRASAYDGRALGNVLGSMIQFGDIKEHGGTGQAGYKFTKNLGFYLTYSTVRPNRRQVIEWTGNGANGDTKGEIQAADLLYTVGPLGLGLEFMHAKVIQQLSLFAPPVPTNGNQVSLSALLKF